MARALRPVCRKGLQVSPPFERRIGELEAELAIVSAAIAAASRRGEKGPSSDAWKRRLALRRHIAALRVAREALAEA